MIYCREPIAVGERRRPGASRRGRPTQARFGWAQTVLLDAAFLQSFQLNLSSFCLIKGVRLNFFGYTRISGGIRFAKA